MHLHGDHRESGERRDRDVHHDRGPAVPTNVRTCRRKAPATCRVGGGEGGYPPGQPQGSLPERQGQGGRSIKAMRTSRSQSAAALVITTGDQRGTAAEQSRPQPAAVTLFCQQRPRQRPSRSSGISESPKPPSPENRKDPGLRSLSHNCTWRFETRATSNITDARSGPIWRPT